MNGGDGGESLSGIACGEGRGGQSHKAESGGIKKAEAEEDDDR